MQPLLEQNNYVVNYISYPQFVLDLSFLLEKYVFEMPLASFEMI